MSDEGSDNQRDDKKNGAGIRGKLTAFFDRFKSKDDHHDSDDDDDDNENESQEDVSYASPIVELAFDFFTEPRTSLVGTYWGIFVAFLVMLHFFAVGLQTVDGPNQYVGGRPDMSRYRFLLSQRGYLIVDYVLNIPLVVDSCCRVIMLFFIFCSYENKGLRRQLSRDRFTMSLLLMDIVGVIPFLVRHIMFKQFSPNEIVLSEGQEIVLLILDLLSTGRILRIAKDIPPIWALRIALSRSFEHLVLPFYFFMVFNITVAALLYFLEPCYNSSYCYWKCLFSSAFYSVVTMTNSKLSSTFCVNFCAVTGRFYQLCKL